MPNDHSTDLEVRVGLPTFVYHPHPIATGAIAANTAPCAACGRARGFLYTGPIYTAQETEPAVCPWCIADGSAAERFEASFSDDHPLVTAGLPEKVIAEVTLRTPGYHSWQGEDWKTCCHDACEFHGDVSRAHLLSLDPAATERFLSLTGWAPEKWQDFVQDVYQPGGSPAIYHFVCRGCQEPVFGWDSD